MDKTRKHCGILDKKNRSVIPHNVPYSVFGIEFNGKTSDVSDSVWISTFTSYSRKSANFKIAFELIIAV